MAVVVTVDHPLPESSSAQELDLHGDLANPYPLWAPAQGAFEQGQGALS